MFSDYFQSSIRRSAVNYNIFYIVVILVKDTLNTILNLQRVIPYNGYDGDFIQLFSRSNPDYLHESDKDIYCRLEGRGSRPLGIFIKREGIRQLNENLFRLIKSLVKFMVKIKSRFQLSFYRMYFPKSKFGENIVLHGSPLFRLLGAAEFGGNLIFRNATRYNPAGINKKCSIYVAPGARLRIGDFSGFSGCSIYCARSVDIGKYCNFGVNVFIWDTDFHPLEYEKRRTHDVDAINSQPVVIGDDVFVGGNSLILKGARIGDRAVIGAGSVVTGNVPNDELWAGNPARFIRKLEPNSQSKAERA